MAFAPTSPFADCAAKVLELHDSVITVTGVLNSRARGISYLYPPFSLFVRAGAVEALLYKTSRQWSVCAPLIEPAPRGLPLMRALWVIDYEPAALHERVAYLRSDEAEAELLAAAGEVTRKAPKGC